jgi:predicted AAA+ superfamily ATPase
MLKRVSFREMLRHIGHEPTQAWHTLAEAAHSQLAHDLDLYLQQGGFPEAQGLDMRSRHALLRNYVDVVLLRDVIERHNISQPQVLRWMVQQLLGNAAGSFSINKFHADLKSRGVAVGKDTLHQLLSYLEDAFLITTISICSSSVRQKQVNPRKVYPVDTGLIALFDRSGKANTGHALECAVLHQLQRSGAEVSYVHTPGGFEVDFHARYPDGREALLQVCADIHSQDTMTREIRALQDAKKQFPQARAQLIVLTPPTTRLSGPSDIELSLASAWLLTD